jgi:glycosyltransferase involved in cell wall biosynthesis
MIGPLVSVIIPAFNAQATIERTLLSTLAQDYDPFEVIVVDDGSTDDTGSVASRIQGVRCLTQENAGPSAARNRGVQEAAGELLAFVDADDEIPPTKLSAQVGYLLENPDIGCVLGRQEVEFEGGGAPDWIGRDPVFDDFAGVPLMSLVCRRDTFRELGGFDPALRIAEDRDLLVRMRERQVGIAVVPDVVLRRRFHGANLTFDRPPSHPLLQSLKDKLDRARAMPDETLDRARAADPEKSDPR